MHCEVVRLAVVDIEPVTVALPAVDAIRLELVGPQGPQGLQGSTGATGPAGAIGAQGATGLGYGGTSTSSNTIGTGPKTWTTQSGLAYLPGQRVRLSADGSNWVEGDVTSYSGGFLTVNIGTTFGAGTHSSWTIGIAGLAGAGAVDSVNGAVGDVTLSMPEALKVARIEGDKIAAIVDAADRVLLTFGSDGKPEFSGIKSPVGDFGSLLLSGTATEQVWGIGFAVMHANGRVALSILDDGTVPFSRFDKYAVDGVAKTDTPDNGAVDFNIHLNSGQSLAVIGNDCTIVDSTDLKLDEAGTALVPLTNPGSYGIGIAATGQIKYALKGDASIALRPSPAFAGDFTQVFQTNAASGLSIAQLSPGASPDRFAANVAAVQSVVDIAAAAGKAAQVPFVTLFQGESDSGSATYKADMIALKNAYNTQVLAATGQPDRFPMMIYQLAGSNSGSVPIAAKAQWQAWREDPEILLAGPMYPYPYADSLHVTAAGTKWFGQLAGKVAYLAAYLGRTWKPLHPLSATVRPGNVVILKLHVPAPPIVLDATTIPAATNYGFRVRDAIGELTVSNVAVVNGDTVRMQLNRVLDDQPMIEYAWRDDPVDGGAGNFDGNGTHAIRGNIRDSDATAPAYGSSFPLWNWLVRFELEITT